MDQFSPTSGRNPQRATVATQHAAGRRVWQLSLALALLLAAGFALADDGSPIKLSSSYYVDDRGFSTASVGIASNRLPHGLSFWGFTDFHGDHDSNSLELTRSFSEYRLTYALPQQRFDGFSVQLESNFITGDGNDSTRLGVGYRHGLSLPWLRDDTGNAWLAWRVFPYETLDNRRQASLIFHLPLTGRMQFKGFADYNIDLGASNRWVAESELNYRVTDRLRALIELRYNQYEQSNPALDGTALAVGFRYRILR